MSGQARLPPYEIRYAPGVGETAAALPGEARRALASALNRIASDPMTAGSAYDPRWPPEFRTVPFGDGGLVAYIVLGKRRQVVIEEIMWVG